MYRSQEHDVDSAKIAKEARPEGAGSSTSQQVSWWAVHQFISTAVAQASTTLPWAGTPAWRALHDTDPRKLLAVAAAGEHHVLRVEIAQEVIAQAAEDVWGGEDWCRVARQVQRRREIDEMRRTA